MEGQTASVTVNGTPYTVELEEAPAAAPVQAAPVQAAQAPAAVQTPAASAPVATGAGKATLFFLRIPAVSTK